MNESRNDFRAEDYKKALSDLIERGKVTDTIRKILIYQYSAHKMDILSSEVPEAIGIYGKNVNSVYGKFAKLFAPYLGQVLDSYNDGSPFYSSYLSDWYRDERGLHWVMHPALAQALEDLGMVEKKADAPTTAVPELEPESGDLPPQTYPEGATRQVTVNAYELNRAARQACVEYHGTICAVCDSDLEEVYGPIADGFIHVHHLKPLSEIGASYSVNPQTDLVPVCPNCHAMLHRTAPPLTVEQLREMIQEAQ